MGALNELPPELVVGWALWIIGGLLLTMWFMRRTTPIRLRDVPAPAPMPGPTRLPGPHADARPISGTHAAHGRSLSGPVAVADRPSTSGRPAAAPLAPSQTHDAFAELRALLDPPEEPPRS
jgi:hypothetical protein